MKKITFVFGALLISVLLFGCGPQASNEEDSLLTPPVKGGENMAPKDASPAQKTTLPVPTEEDATSYKDGVTCREEGGSWIRGQNIDRSYLCLKPYPDAGKSCKDSKDCYGKCLGRMNEDTEEYEGYCQKNNNPYGCFIEMKKGDAQKEVCVN